LTAEVGAQVLRDGGNAVDAALGAMLASFATEGLLTGLGAGGYMMVAGGGQEPTLLDFFVEAPTRRNDGSEAELLAVDVSFGDAVQAFHIGAASCGVYGNPAGICAAARRWGNMPLEQLVEPAAHLAEQGVALNGAQAYVAEILADLLTSTPECAALWAPEGRVLREGETFRNPDLAKALRRLGREGSEPFYRGDIAARVCSWLGEQGASLSRSDLASYEAVEREPVAVRYRGREILTNPPPSAGGILLAYALALLDRAPSPPAVSDIVHVMAAAQAERNHDFLEGLSQEGFLARFMDSRLGSTTHIAVIDADGMACSTTSTNGEGSGVVVPGTGIHMNNVMGEEDLNPAGFHLHPAGRRMPSMMAPSIVMRDGEVELALGSAGSNRIRSALLQTIVAVLDHGLDAQAAVEAPRLHYQDGIVYAEPGIDLESLQDDVERVRFRGPNLFFGGVQAALSRDGALGGGGDPRRGGAVVRA
jgi:gamma-glutamyltranspeptidase/glutathione hydrolase